MNYSIALGQQQEEVLQINGKQSICPFSAPLPFTGNMGQIQIMRMPCSTICPHASLTSNNEFYIITCGTGIQKLALDNNEQQEKSAKLIKL